MIVLIDTIDSEMMKDIKKINIMMKMKFTLLIMIMNDIIIIETIKKAENICIDKINIKITKTIIMKMINIMIHSIINMMIEEIDLTTIESSKIIINSIQIQDIMIGKVNNMGITIMRNMPITTINIAEIRDLGQKIEKIE